MSAQTPDKNSRTWLACQGRALDWQRQADKHPKGSPDWIEYTAKAREAEAIRDELSAVSHGAAPFHDKQPVDSETAAKLDKALASEAPASSIEPTKGQLRAMLSAWFGRGYTHNIDEEVPEFVERMKAVYAAAEFVAARSATLPPEANELAAMMRDAARWRWLRDVSDWVVHPCPAAEKDRPDYDPGALDHRIDEYMRRADGSAKP